MQLLVSDWLVKLRHEYSLTVWGASDALLPLSASYHIVDAVPHSTLALDLSSVFVGYLFI